MIPEEAVEAACEQLFESGVSVSKKDMRLALEAAAPHLMAAAWDEAIDWTPEHRPANPYRKDQS